MMQLDSIAKNWEALYQAQLQTIKTESQYLEMLEFMRELMRHYDTTQEPHRSLWRLAAQYVSDWELVHDDLATESIQGFELLRAIVNNHQFTQENLAKQLGINQSHLSRILKGERSISRKLALQLEKQFQVSADQFIKSA
jgi:HTH-type transcriptional regulator / antitoxin HigA